MATSTSPVEADNPTVKANNAPVETDGPPVKANNTPVKVDENPVENPVGADDRLVEAGDPPVEVDEPSASLLFGLAAEIRQKIYENVLIHPVKLQPNGPSYQTDDEGSYGVSTSILRTCRLIHDEAYPILYRKNFLEFHDNQSEVVYNDYPIDESDDESGYKSIDVSIDNLLGVPPLQPILPFPEDRLSLVKRASVQINPFIYGSTRTMAAFLTTLAESDKKDHQLELSISIHLYIVSDAHNFHSQCPEPLDSDKFLYGENPLVPAIFSLIAVKKLHIILLNEAVFELGVADELKARFMLEGGSAESRSITIKKGCGFTHQFLEEDATDLDDEEQCDFCGNKWKDIRDGKADFTYGDHMPRVWD